MLHYACIDLLDQLANVWSSEGKLFGIESDTPVLQQLSHYVPLQVLVSVSKVDLAYWELLFD